MHVKLTPIEIYQAALVGVARRIDSRQKGLADGAPGGWQSDIEGALAEMAFAKAMNVYGGLTISNYKGADIGDYHIRSSQHENGRLIIRPDDSLNGKYVLLTGFEGDYIVHGYIHGNEGRKDQYWMAPNGRPGAWFVPQDALTKF
jgi:hypothetical protein